MPDYANVDCAKGRAMGCQTYCCRLLVRLDDDEREPGGPRFVKKDQDGYCVHLDRDNHRCNIWDKRSHTCRGYDCNGDFLLQVAVRNEFANIVELVRLAANFYIAKEFYVRVPPTAE